MIEISQCIASESRPAGRPSKLTNFGQFQMEYLIQQSGNLSRAHLLESRMYSVIYGNSSDLGQGDATEHGVLRPFRKNCVVRSESNI